MKRNSWHFRLATFYGPLFDPGSHRDHTVNICRYTWALLGGLWNVLLILIGATVCSFGVGDMLAWIASSIAMGSFLHMGEPAQVTVGIITIFFGSIVVFILSQKIGGWREHKRMQLYENLHTKNVSIPTTIHKEPGIIAVWYKNFKEKTCVNITIEKETSDHE